MTPQPPKTTLLASPSRASPARLLAHHGPAPSAPRLARLGLPSLGPSPRPSGRHRLPAAPASSGLAASPATGLLTGGSPPCPPRAGHRLPASSVTGTRNTKDLCNYPDARTVATHTAGEEHLASPRRPSLARQASNTGPTPGVARLRHGTCVLVRTAPTYIHSTYVGLERKSLVFLTL